MSIPLQFHSISIQLLDESQVFDFDFEKSHKVVLY